MTRLFMLDLNFGVLFLYYDDAHTQHVVMWI